MKPAFKLIINGKPLNITRRQLIDLTITDNKAFESDQLSATISDAKNTINIPEKGAKIECWIGWEKNKVPQLTYKGSFTVDDNGYDINPREITFYANSANFKEGLSKAETKSYHKKTFGNIAERIAKKHKLNLSIHESIDSIYIDHVDQNNEGDGNFLTRLSQKYDAMFNIKNDTLIVLPQGKAQTGSGKKLSPLDIHVTECESATYKETDENNEYTGVKAKWHNTQTGKTEWVIAGKADKSQRLKQRYHNKEDALRVANAEWGKIQRGKKTLSITLTKGKPDWITEKPVIATGIKPQIDALQWVTKKVIHQINNNGYTCSGELEYIDISN